MCLGTVPVGVDEEEAVGVGVEGVTSVSMRIRARICLCCAYFQFWLMDLFSPMPKRNIIFLFVWVQVVLIADVGPEATTRITNVCCPSGRSTRLERSNRREHGR